jgi:hypothetical protein
MVDISSIIVKFNKLFQTVDQREVEFSTKLKLRYYIILTKHVQWKDTLIHTTILYLH